MSSLRQSRASGPELPGSPEPLAPSSPDRAGGPKLPGSPEPLAPSSPNKNPRFPYRRLPHDVPLWIDASREIYFLTICCKPKGVNQLAIKPLADALWTTVIFRVEKQLWWPHLLLLMPDHLHGLFSFPSSHKTIESLVTDWKGWTAKKLGIQWQRDFFEHRIRNEPARREKADYILANPVRAGLVNDSKEWPFVWTSDDVRTVGGSTISPNRAGGPELPGSPEPLAPPRRNA